MLPLAIPTVEQVVPGERELVGLGIEQSRRHTTDIPGVYLISSPTRPTEEERRQID
jgi:hypothetical protein